MKNWKRRKGDYQKKEAQKEKEQKGDEKKNNWLTYRVTRYDDGSMDQIFNWKEKDLEYGITNDTYVILYLKSFFPQGSSSSDIHEPYMTSMMSHKHILNSSQIWLFTVILLTIYGFDSDFWGFHH